MNNWTFLLPLLHFYKDKLNYIIIIMLWKYLRIILILTGILWKHLKFIYGIQSEKIFLNIIPEACLLNYIIIFVLAVWFYYFYVYIINMFISGYAD